MKPASASLDRIVGGMWQVEMFMVGVEILSEGDHVNELMIVLGGLVEVVTPADVRYQGASDNEASVCSASQYSSMYGGSVIDGDQSISISTSPRQGRFCLLAVVSRSEPRQ